MAKERVAHVMRVELRVHPDMHAHIERQAAARYQDMAEWVRQLIVDDMRRVEATEVTA